MAVGPATPPNDAAAARPWWRARRVVLGLDPLHRRNEPFADWARRKARGEWAERQRRRAKRAEERAVREGRNARRTAAHALRRHLDAVAKGRYGGRPRKETRGVRPRKASVPCEGARRPGPPSEPPAAARAARPQPAGADAGVPPSPQASRGLLAGEACSRLSYATGVAAADAEVVECLRSAPPPGRGDGFADVGVAAPAPPHAASPAVTQAACTPAPTPTPAGLWGDHSEEEVHARARFWARFQDALRVRGPPPPRPVKGSIEHFEHAVAALRPGPQAPPHKRQQQPLPPRPVSCPVPPRGAAASPYPRPFSAPAPRAGFAHMNMNAGSSSAGT
eukprot:TRINITY_DN4308_c0_g7_i1.p1 TRINITY_DN4308_c0_g7~~TRINITY_DN4308_c0_g7_i1.p1  ORF type:complete len:335 (+),score=64.74 TRINITY_DN4308_c0_g7_i1:70-1074(+)